MTENCCNENLNTLNHDRHKIYQVDHNTPANPNPSGIIYFIDSIKYIFCGGLIFLRLPSFSIKYCDIISY